MLARDQVLGAFGNGLGNHAKASPAPHDDWQSPTGPEDYGYSADGERVDESDTGTTDKAGAEAIGTPPQGRPLQWLDMSRWDSAPVPERQWAIKDRVPLKQAGLFSGEGGTGK